MLTTASIRRIDSRIVERMSALMPWHFSEFNFSDLRIGISYHKCRYCGQGSDEHEGLWKYGVRHWVCTPCRDAITSAR